MGIVSFFEERWRDFTNLSKRFKRGAEEETPELHDTISHSADNSIKNTIADTPTDMWNSIEYTANYTTLEL